MLPAIPVQTWSQLVVRPMAESGLQGKTTDSAQ